MKYEVTYMPSDVIPSKIVNTIEEAEDYIKKYLCSRCLKDLERGYQEDEYFDLKENKTKIVKYPIKLPSHTLCGLNFLIQEIK